MLDSDISSGILLAHRLNVEHSITGLCRNWIYATGIRFLESQWLYRIGLALSPGNWHVARTIAMAMSLALLTFSSWLVFHSIGRKEWGLWAAAFTVFPGGGWYFWQTIFGLQYTPYIMISHFSFALIMLAKRHKGSVRGKVYTGLLLLLGLGAGVNGIKQLMVFYAPLCITALCALLKSIRNKRIMKDGDTVFFFLAVSASISAIAGYLVNTKVLAKIYPFEQYDSTVIEYQGFFECLKMYIWDFGFADGKVLMSPWGIASMCGVLFGLIVVLSGIRIMTRLGELDDDEQILTVLSVTSILFSCFIFAYLSGHGDIQYFQPVIPMGYFLVVTEIFSDKIFGGYKQGGFIAVNLAMIIMLVASAGTVHNENDGPIHKYRARQGLGAVVDMLVDKGYTQGVSQFWTSNVVTEMSDGVIEMWTISTESPDEFLNRAQKKDHMENPPSGRYFYLFDLTRGEEEANVDLGLAYVEKHQEAGALAPIYYDENYIIYGN